jgi:hypothetical protein
MAYMIAKHDRKTHTYVLIKREGISSPAPLVPEVQEHLADELLAHCLRLQEIVKGLELTFPNEMRLHDAGHLAALALSQLVEAHAEAWASQHSAGQAHGRDPDRIVEVYKQQLMRRELAHMGALYTDEDEEDPLAEQHEQSEGD